MADSNWFRKPLIRHAEQSCAGSVLIVSLIAIAFCTYRQQQRSRGSIDLQRPHEQRTLTFQVDINRAEAAELRLLPGVGATIAERIMESRRTDGPFRSANDLLRVRGIGPRTVARIEPYLMPFAAARDVADQ